MLIDRNAIHLSRPGASPDQFQILNIEEYENVDVKTTCEIIEEKFGKNSKKTKKLYEVVTLNFQR
nr:AIS_HP1_G0006400.mRNA.1.CDS.1 [Saccharomyces cerevisiae]